MKLDLLILGPELTDCVPALARSHINQMVSRGQLSPVVNNGPGHGKSHGYSPLQLMHLACAGALAERGCAIAPFVANASRVDEAEEANYRTYCLNMSDEQAAEMELLPIRASWPDNISRVILPRMARIAVYLRERFRGMGHAAAKSYVANYAATVEGRYAEERRRAIAANGVFRPSDDTYSDAPTFTTPPTTNGRKKAKMNLLRKARR